METYRPTDRQRQRGLKPERNQHLKGIDMQVPRLHGSLIGYEKVAISTEEKSDDL